MAPLEWSASLRAADFRQEDGSPLRSACSAGPAAGGTLARLAALIPPPRYPLTRYHGVLAPASRWRSFVVPRPPVPSPGSIERPASVLSAEHWARLRDGRDLARAGRVDWATLLRRTFAVDVLSCPSCGGRRQPVEVVVDEEVAGLLLARMGLEAAAPPLARARDPTDDEEVGRPSPGDLEATGSAVDDDQVPRQGGFGWAE